MCWILSFTHFIFLNLFIYLFGDITLQYGDGFLHTSTWIGQRYTHVSPPAPTPPQPSRLSQALALGALLHAYNLHWPSILCMVMCMLQCYFLKKSIFNMILKKWKQRWLKPAVTREKIRWEMCCVKRGCSADYTSLPWPFLATCLSGVGWPLDPIPGWPRDVSWGPAGSELQSITVVLHTEGLSTGLHLSVKFWN